VVALSVTEGEDKPLKYPVMFRKADLVLLTKIDLVPHLDADLAAIRDALSRVRPEPRMIAVSARTGEGIAEWLTWREARRPRAMAGAPHAHAHGSPWPTGPILGSELPPADDPRDQIVVPDEPHGVAHRRGGRIEQRRQQPLVARPGAAGRRHDREAPAYRRIVSLFPCHIRKATHPHASLRAKWTDGDVRRRGRSRHPRKVEGLLDQRSSSVRRRTAG
jgi:G3E family GTPase